MPKLTAKQQDTTMATALKAMLADVPDVTCSDFHHNRADYHDGIHECPVVKRWEAAVASARAALAAFNEKENPNG